MKRCSLFVSAGVTVGGGIAIVRCPNQALSKDVPVPPYGKPIPLCRKHAAEKKKEGADFVRSDKKSADR